MMRRSVVIPAAAPVGQQAPPARAAASAVKALRSARGSPLLTTGTALTPHQHLDKKHRQVLQA
jgi:hypothetical protein